MTEAIDIDAVALAVADVLAVLDPEPVIRSASVSEVYKTRRWSVPAMAPEAMPLVRPRLFYWRVTVAINDTHTFQPRFSCREDAEAYREAVTEALDRAT